MTEHEIFVAALGRPAGADRDTFLREACGSDGALRQRIQALLAAHDAAGSFLEKPAAELTPTMDMPPLAEGPGTTVGPYKLLQQIGEGGFGVVYMAEQLTPVRRKLALKIIKPGMDTREVVARFESERQALALMDHPNIARVLDAGATDSGRPFFVMELVKGVPITDFCDKNHLPVEQRLELFMDVCRAVQHAHQKGIIHRDLKPSNVMVTLHDGKPVAKVIDFGVAKATSQQLTQRTLFTAYGQMIGTPVYMSPEQAEMSGLDIDTRSDIYSLGVLLYELLTGSTPLELDRLRTAGFVEMQRLIREEEPQRPSTRLSTLGGKATVLAANRNTDVKKLNQLLSGDLDWIVMKALEKDRSRRYETPSAFAADLQRFLNHEVIVARPPSTTYRLRKLIVRNRLAVAATSAVVMALLAGTIASTLFGIDARKQRDLAIEADRTTQASLRDAQEQRQKAESERDRANQASAAEAKQAAIAEERRKEAHDQRTLAERERDQARQLRDETDSLNHQLRDAVQEQRRAIYAAEMNQVRIESQRSNLPRMRELLMQQLPINGEEDLRGFEWNYWYRYLKQAQVLMHVEGFMYGPPAYSVSAVCPGGDFVAVTKGTDTQLIKLNTRDVVATIPLKLRTLVERTRFSSTGRSVWGFSSWKSYWNAGNQRIKGVGCTVHEATGEKINFQYPDNSFSHVSFFDISRDGSRIAVIGIAPEHEIGKPATRLLVFDVDSRSLLLNQIQPRELNRLEFSPDGSMIAAYLCHSSDPLNNDERDVAVVIDVATRQETGVARHNDEIDALYWLPDQRRVLLSTLGYSGANRLELLSWTIDSSRPQNICHETMPNYIKGAVSPDGRLLAVTGHTVNSIRLIDTTRGNVAATLQTEATTIDSLTFTPDSRYVVACSTGGDVLRWDLAALDLFALKSKPLAQLAYNGYALTDNQQKLAIALANGAVLIRDRDGTETRLRRPFKSPQRATVTLKFSPDNRYLAHVSNVDLEGRSITGSFFVELYDVRSGQRKWHVAHKPAVVRSVMVEFSPDFRQVAILEGDQLVLLDCETGSASLSLSYRADIAGQTCALVRNRRSGRLLTAGALTSESRKKTLSVFIADVYSRTMLVETELPLLNEIVSSLTAARLAPSADGEHLAFARTQPPSVEVWNLRTRQRVFAVSGDRFTFSDDGRRIAVSTWEAFTQPGQIGALSRIRQINVLDVSGGESLCEIDLRGDGADEVRFSPDGKRLLTLHGKGALGSGGAAAKGRLWDIVSGREILAIPVADVNNYIWDLFFDSTGNQLTSLLFAKSSGTGAGGESAAYDATPLSAEDDAQLVANRLLQSVAGDVLLPAELTAVLDKRPGLNPRVREIVVEKVGRASPDSRQIAESISDTIAFAGRSEKEYERAFRRAELLNTSEPDSLRAKVLMSAGHYRLGKPDAALALLNDLPDTRTEASEEWTYQCVGAAIQTLAYHKLGDAAKAEQSVASIRERFISRTSREFTNRSVMRLLVEAITSQGAPLANSTPPRIAAGRPGPGQGTSRTSSDLSLADAFVVARKYSVPLLKPEEVTKARRITGWCSCWSPDGTRIVRNENPLKGDDSDLSVFNLETGESTVLCRGGVDPFWSPVPGGAIALTRAAAGKKRDPKTEEVWLVNPDGTSLRKLAPGGFPTWTNDGRLFFRSLDQESRFELRALQPGESHPVVQTFPLQSYYPTISRDGTMIVSCTRGLLGVHSLATGKEVVAVPLGQELGTADFSPDGKYVVYGSWMATYPGLMLIEIATGKARSLTNDHGTMPRWSPDGRFIAADERDKNQIVILDVSGIHLPMVFAAVSPPAQPSETPPKTPAAP